MVDQPNLSDALELLASLEAQCEELRRIGSAQEALGELEALLAEIRAGMSTLRRQD
jgi:hypothetical protein